MRKRYITLLSVCTILLWSCSSDDTPTPQNPPVDTTPDPPMLTIPSTGYNTPMSYDGMELVWSDEFDGTELNEEDWNYELGTGINGWGNFEAQHYRKENTSLVEGNLVIEAKRELFSSSLYTSSRLSTQGKREFKYGRIDVRAAMPFGNGMWPAIWMLGANFGEVGWPKCGEIDIMEMFGAQGNNKVLGTVHWDNAGDYANFGGSTTLGLGNLKDEYHVYSIAWDEELIRWYFDDQQFHAIDITPEELSEFREEFFMIINLAIGGDKGAGDPANTSFPQWMIVDYVRVFQDL